MLQLITAVSTNEFYCYPYIFSGYFRTDNITLERSFLCSECGKCFQSGHNLRLHMAVHTEPTIQCPDCPAKFKNEKAFKRHYQWHQNLTYKCNKCSQTFSRKMSLQTHRSKLYLVSVELLLKHIRVFFSSDCRKSTSKSDRHEEI